MSGGREGIWRQEEGEWNGVAGKGERDGVGSNGGEGVGCGASGICSDYGDCAYAIACSSKIT